jgi:hypothetical protein
MALFAAAGAIVLAAIAFGVWALTPRGAADPQVASIEGRWVGEGQDCRYAMRLVIDGESLNVLVPGAPASQIAITAQGADGVVATEEGSYSRLGENLVAHLSDGSEQVFSPCS